MQNENKAPPLKATTVLLVEDDMEAAQTLKDILEDQSYRVVLATSYRDALRQAQALPIGLAIVDMYLADDTTGLDVLRQIKESSPDTECLVVTGYTNMDNAVRSLNLGAFCYLHKPIDMPYLLKSLERALEKQHQAQALRQRLRELEAVARLNAQVLSERADLIYQMETERAQLNTVYRATLKASRASSIPELLTDLVTLIECSHYTCVVPLTPMGTMGRRIEHYRDLEPFALEVNWDGLASRVISSGQAAFQDSVSENGLNDPLLKAAGIRSLAALPLKAGPDCLGLLFLHSLYPEAFTPKVALLGFLVETYALAWQRLGSLEAAATALRGWETAFDAVREGIAMADAERHIVRANAALGRLLDTPPELLEGKPAGEVFLGTKGKNGQAPATETTVKALLHSDGSVKGYLYIMQPVGKGVTQVAGN
ncbi:MAG: hypothetical protein HW388_1720 [Dehalococcoidia bacterium]|nr:hypothetical protein [Dehalococcoidia bacterium]